MFYNKTYYLSHCIINKSNIFSIFSRLLIKHCMHHIHKRWGTVFQNCHIFSFATQYANTEANIWALSLAIVTSHKLCWYL